MLRGLLVKPNAHPVVVEVEKDYRAIQKLIGGPIEVVRMSKDVVLCFDEEGRCKDGILSNRALFANEHTCTGTLEEGMKLQIKYPGIEGSILGLPGCASGEMLLAILGPFLILGDDGSDFASLTAKQIEKYRKRFYYPELITKIGGHLVALRFRRPL